jgi:ubiquitin-activating enzyme E1
MNLCFAGLFTQAAESAAQYLQDPNFVDRIKLPGVQPLEVLEAVKKALVDDRPHSFFDCVSWARKHWQVRFKCNKFKFKKEKKY